MCMSFVGIKSVNTLQGACDALPVSLEAAPLCPNMQRFGSKPPVDAYLHKILNQNFGSNSLDQILWIKFFGSNSLDQIWPFPEACC